MKQYKARFIVHVRGIGRPNYTYSFSSPLLSGYEETEAIDSYLHQILYDDNFDLLPHILNSYRIEYSAFEV